MTTEKTPLSGDEILFVDADDDPSRIRRIAVVNHIQKLQDRIATLEAKLAEETEALTLLVGGFADMQARAESAEENLAELVKLCTTEDYWCTDYDRPTNDYTRGWADGLSHSAAIAQKVIRGR